MRTNLISRVVALLSLSLAANMSLAQMGWVGACADPEKPPVNVEVAGISNPYIGCGLGIGGTIYYGNGVCYKASRTLDVQGRFALYVGFLGSYQTDFDDHMGLTVGALFDACGDYCYARIISYSDPAADDSGKTTLFGGAGFTKVFEYLSGNHTMVAEKQGTTETELDLSVTGDAIRYEWKITNKGETPMYLGVKFGAYAGMRSNSFDPNGYNQANALFPLPALNEVPKPGDSKGLYVGYTVTDTTSPLFTERNFLASDADFPSQIQFLFGQNTPYGMRLDMGPSTEAPDQSRVSQLIIGNHGAFGNGILWNNNMASRIAMDTGSGDPVLNSKADPVVRKGDRKLIETSFIQTFTPQLTAPGGTAKVVHYVRSPWAVSNYVRPYAVVIDAPRLVESAPGTGLNDLYPNPITIRASVENQLWTRGAGKDGPMSNVKLTLNLPEGGGLTLTGGSKTQQIATIPSAAITTVEWEVEVDNTQVGRLPFTITVDPPGFNAKTLSSSVMVAATPTVRLGTGPNLIAFPWSFADSSLDSILGLHGGIDYIAYKWEPGLSEYVPATSAIRGESIWLLPLNDLAYHELQGAESPLDIVNGGLITTLQPGWNMIGNPYSYPICPRDLIGYSKENPDDQQTWDEMVQGGLISQSLAYWDRDPEDPESGSYKYTQGSSDLMMPNRGYWVYVASLSTIRITWPPVFIEGLSSSDRSRAISTWKQSDKQWRLQLSARTDKGAADLNNYVGVASSSKEATRLRIYEPPKSPNSKVELAIEDELDGKPTRLAQSLSEKLARKEWKVLVHASETGDVTLSWPNISQIPRNINFQLVDKATNTARDLRFMSSYKITMSEPGTREFILKMAPGNASKVVIGNVVVSRPGRGADPRAPFTINYTLSTEATTTVRILTGGGKEVFTITRGRADRVGENTATWTMRDNANRAVAPGTYQCEILAETSTGERVRRTVPVNVVR